MISKRRFGVCSALSAVALSLLLQGCGSTSGDTNIMRRDLDEIQVIQGNPSLARKLTIQEPRERLNGDRKEVQLDLVNNRGSSLAFQWRVDWFDESGFRVDDSSSTWEPVKLAGKSSTTLHFIAPRPEAEYWQIQVSDPNEVN